MSAPTAVLNFVLGSIVLIVTAIAGLTSSHGQASAGKVVAKQPLSIVETDDVGLRLRDRAAEHELLDVITAWLASQFGLQAVYEHPQIELVPAAKIVSMGYWRLLLNLETKAAAGNEDEAPASGQREVVAVYDDATRTIYLPEQWSGASAIEQSMLVHEMVHHFQNVLGIRHACPQERERLAYEAQKRWLARSGLNLEDEFEVDPFSLLVRTTCPVLN